MTFFLITTDHLETRLWFRAKALLPISVAFYIGVHVLAFILMSNHVHFVLECTEEEALRFITEFKRIHSWYLRCKYGVKELLRENDVDIQELVLGNESLERAIAYVQMNCVAANICLHPTEYPWGTGRAFFQVGRADGTALGNLSGRARHRILHSRMNLPSGWLLGPDGFILPESYVNVRFVENLFRSPGRMNYFLTNSSKAKRTLARQEAEARETAKLYNQLKPAMIYASELTLFPDTPLSRDVSEGKFAEATERERMEEMQEFIRCLTVPTIFRAEHVTMPVRINGRVPEDKEAMISRLQETMDTNGEERLQMYRSSVYSL